MREHTGKNVSLTPKHRAFVEGLVASGQYGSASEVVRASLRLLEREEKRRLLEKWFLEGLSAEEEAKLGPELLAKAGCAMDRWLDESLASGPVEDATDAWMAERFRALGEHTARLPKSDG